ADPAYGNFHHRARIDGVHALVARQLLRFPFDPPRNHRRHRSALPSFWKVLSHFSTSGAAWREALPERRRIRSRHAMLALWRTLCFTDAHSRFERSASRIGIRLHHACGTHMAGSLSGVQKEIFGNNTVAVEETAPWHGRRLTSHC